MKKTFTLALALVALLAACGGRQAPTAAPAAKPTAATQPTAVPAAKPTIAPAATKATEAPTATQGEALSLLSRETGLDKLKSYRARWQAEWRSTESGKTDSGTWDWTQEYSAESQALHHIWKGTGNAASDSAGMELWQIGDTLYMLSAEAGGKTECFTMSSDDKSNRLDRGTFTPGLLGSLKGANYVGAETVNGIKAKHYKYDEKASTLTGFGKVAGDIWVATDGGYVVKDVVTWSGSAGLFGMMAQGAGDGKWTWELRDVNQPIRIQPPANCVAPTTGLPLLPDAKEKISVGPMIVYKSATKPADATAFYKKEMVAAGWKLTDEQATGDQVTTLNFEKGDEKAQVFITSQDDITQVMINTAK